LILHGIRSYSGKIPEEDYPAQRNALLVKGAETLRQLDAYQPPSSQQTAEDRLEAAVAARRIVATSAPAGAPRADDQLEVIIAERRRAREGKSAGFCHKCGSPLQISDRFCPRCGAAAA
jgi:septum formation topological specificity factor MinE